MSDKVWFDPTSDKWVLSDGEHHLEVPQWAREIIVDEFERETRQLKDENAKLRDDRDGWKKVCIDQEVMHVMHEDALDNEIAKLRELVDAAHMSRLLTENENEELRELARDVWHLFTEHGAVNPCDLPVVDAVRDRMRELGAEVYAI